jgi:hypothetical protein
MAFAGPACGAEDIGSERAHIVQQDGGLFVPVRIQLHAPLLHQHATEVLRRVEAVTRKIAFHVCSPSSL